MLCNAFDSRGCFFSAGFDFSHIWRKLTDDVRGVFVYSFERFDQVSGSTFLLKSVGASIVSIMVRAVHLCDVTGAVHLCDVTGAVLLRVMAGANVVCAVAGAGDVVGEFEKFQSLIPWRGREFFQNFKGFGKKMSKKIRGQVSL